jgi:hypothetical protein
VETHPWLRRLAHPVIAVVIGLGAAAVALAVSFAPKQTALGSWSCLLVAWGLFTYAAALLLKDTRNSLRYTAFLSLTLFMLFFGRWLTTSAEQPDVTLRFVYPTTPNVQLVNDSGIVAREIKWAVILFNLDAATKSPFNPLPIPFSTFDFLRGHTNGGPMGFLDAPDVRPLVHKGDRLCGSASVICPDCGRGHTYLVYIVVGEGGWFSEVLSVTSGTPLIPKHLTEAEVMPLVNMILSTPETLRVAIAER